MKISTLRATNDKDPRPINALAGAIAGAIKTNGAVVINAVGSEANYNALRSVMKAEEMLHRDPGWENLRINMHCTMTKDKHKKNFQFVKFVCKGVR